MGHLISPNVASWNDFCHTKNLKIPPTPIIRCGLIEGEKWVVTMHKLAHHSEKNQTYRLRPICVYTRLVFIELVSKDSSLRTL